MHHDEHAHDAGHLTEKIEDEGGGDVVGKVGDEHPPGRPRQQAGPVARHRVGLDHRHPERLDHLAKDRHDAPVHLDRGHLCPGRGEGDGQGTEPGTYLDDVISGTDTVRAGRCVPPCSGR